MVEATFAGVPLPLLDQWDVQTYQLDNVMSDKLARQINDYHTMEVLATLPTKPTNPLEEQEGGNHYKTYKIQPVEFSMANGLDLCQSNVVKYVCRFKDKGGKGDLLKARHYIDLLIHFTYGNKE